MAALRPLSVVIGGLRLANSTAGRLRLHHVLECSFICTSVPPNKVQ